MEKPVLVIMAAGMGSRYGGLKQIDPVDEDGDIIMDFSIYDAKRAGFEKVIFIIKRENEQAFKEAVGRRMEGIMDVDYVYQELEDLPEGYAVPEGREKPWGTGHAILCCAQQINGPFAVINADDYYGPKAFALIYDYLCTHPDDTRYRYAMVGYELGKTVTEHGVVARGICQINDRGELVDIKEHTKIEKKEDGIAYTEDEGKTWTYVPEDSIVSMNLWGFTKSILKELKERFPAFLERGLQENPLKCEYFLPAVVDELLKEDKASAAVLHTPDTWYGVTYAADKPVVEEAVKRMKEEGRYPQHLWAQTEG